MKKSLNHEINPFKKNGYMLPIASINRHMVHGVQANQLFSPRLIITEMLQNKDIFDISEETSSQDIFSILDKGLQSSNLDLKNRSIGLINMFSRRLLEIIKTLVQNDVDSMNQRAEWNESHWTYWKQIKQVIFVGGYLLNNISRQFQLHMNQMMKDSRLDIKVQFVSNSSHFAIIGMNTLTQENTLMFDLGQTSIKRAKCDAELLVLESIPTAYLDSNSDAEDLNRLILDSICNTINDVEFVGHEIWLAISNYVTDEGLTASNAGYGKLSIIDKHYDRYLKRELERIYGREFQVHLYHDASAMALNFTHQSDTAVLSLGTAFGIAFTE